MKILFVALLAVVCPQIASAQFGLNVSGPSTATVGGNIRYAINVTNLTGIELSNVIVSNSFPTSLDFVNADPTDTGPFFQTDGRVIFTINRFAIGEAIPFTLTLRATEAGTVVNTVTVSGSGAQPATDSTSTSVGAAPVQSDLSVSIRPASTNVFVNDWVTYTINVTNRGGTASGVFVTNVLTNGLIAIRPSTSNQRIIFNLGTLAAQRGTNLQVTVQPTIATNFTISAHVRALSDTNAGNNSATMTMSVMEPPPSQLEAMINSPQRFNPQNALIEQLIVVSNASSTSSVASARVILSNFNHTVVNAVGMNNGHPFVVHGAPLQTNESVELLLEYFIPTREPGDDPDLIAYSVGNVNLDAPTTGTNIAITKTVILRPNQLIMNTNRLLIEFPAALGATYQILYSTNMFASARRALPPVVAQANRLQWIDYGPPKTLSRPMFGPTFATNDVFTTNMMGTNIVVTTNMGVVTTNMTMRFYRAIRLP